MRKLAFLAATLLAVGCVGGDDPPTNSNPSNQNPNNGGTNTLVDPVIVHPCTALTAEQVSTAVGATVTISLESPADDKREYCYWSWAEGRVDADVIKRSNAADFRQSWEEATSDATDRMTLDWSPDGELRAGTNADGVGVASLFAYVINTDAIGRDVYITLQYVPEADPSTGESIAIPLETQKSAFLELGHALSDAVRAAQPEGVELP